MENGRAGARWLLIPVLGLVLSVSGAAADLEPAWEAQLRGRVQRAQLLLGTDLVMTAEHLLTAAILALELGDLDRARAALEPITADPGRPDYPGAALLLGRLHLADGRDDAARSAFAASLERSADGPYAAAAHLALIRLDLHAGAFDAAGTRLDRLAALGPSPEWELASELLDPKRGPGPVRPFPSPVGLFAAARLSAGVVPPPVTVTQPRAAFAGGKTETTSATQSDGRRTGLQPVALAERGAAPIADPLPAAFARQPEAPSAAPAGPRTGLRPLSAATAPGMPRFTVRLGSFREPVNAQHMLKALRDDDFDARIVVAGGFSQVLIGAVSTRQQAQALLDRVRPLGYDGDVISYPADATR